MISPMMPGNASAVFTLNVPSSLAYPFFRALFIFRQRLICCASSPTTGKQHFDQNVDGHANCCEYGSNHNVLLPKSVSIFSANVVSLSNTLAIISLKLVICLISLLMLSCLTIRSKLSLVIHFLMSS